MAFKDNWQQEYIMLALKSWASFLHPDHGYVAGRVIECEYLGRKKTGRYELPDFMLTVKGRSTRSHNVLEITVSKDYICLYRTEQEAVADANEREHFRSQKKSRQG